MTPDFWDRLWQSGLPVVLLAIGVVVLWVTWRADVKNASEERTLNRKSVDELRDSFDKLREKLESFFLTHFP